MSEICIDTKIIFFGWGERDKNNLIIKKIKITKINYEDL